MIRLISCYGTLAKSAPNFRGFPMCKNSKFSQDFQGFCYLFLSCEEKPIWRFCPKNVKSLIMSVEGLIRFFARDFCSMQGYQ